MPDDQPNLGPKTKLLVVTPMQLAGGYVEMNGVMASHKRFRVVGKRLDGNYVVIDPKSWEYEQPWQ